MEITQLRASVTEDDLNEILKRHLPRGLPVQDIKIGIAPQGIVIQGVYPMFVNVAFETLWEPTIQQGRLALQLTQFKAMGMGGNMFKGAVLKQIAEAVQGKDFIGMVGDTLILDLDLLLQKSGVTAKTNLTRMGCEAGRLVLEAG